jgi:hypothetical protein
MQNLNVVYPKKSSFNKCVIKNIRILHECKESKDANRMMRQSENECQYEKEHIDNFINPLHNKNVNDYNDDIEICIMKTNDGNANKKLNFKSNLTLDIEYSMCHVSKQKYLFDISKLFLSMLKNDVHDHINEPYDKIVKFVKKVNLKIISKY